MLAEPAGLDHTVERNPVLSDKAISRAAAVITLVGAGATIAGVAHFREITVNGETNVKQLCSPKQQWTTRPPLSSANAIEAVAFKRNPEFTGAAFRCGLPTELAQFMRASAN